MSSFFITAALAQGEHQVAEAEKITYFGLDASFLVVVGESGVTGKELVNKYFKGWNSVVSTERDKYDLKKIFRKEVVEYDLSIVDRLNSKRDPSALIASEGVDISQDQLASHIKQHYSTGEQGVGLVIALESFNKYIEKGSMWVTFFDMQSGSILLAKHMSGKPTGFGVRNYWVRTVYNVLMDSKKQYRRWMKD